MRRKGVITAINDRLYQGMIVDKLAHEAFPFPFHEVIGYHGQILHKFGLEEGNEVSFVVAPNGSAEEIRVERKLGFFERICSFFR